MYMLGYKKQIPHSFDPRHNIKWAKNETIVYMIFNGIKALKTITIYYKVTTDYTPNHKYNEFHNYAEVIEELNRVEQTTTK